MMIQPALATLIGGWELVMILAALLVFAVSVAAIVGLVLFIVKMTQKKTDTVSQTPPRI
jgi:hypothetical protein